MTKLVHMPQIFKHEHICQHVKHPRINVDLQTITTYSDKRVFSNYVVQNKFQFHNFLKNNKNVKDITFLLKNNSLSSLNNCKNVAFNIAYLNDFKFSLWVIVLQTPRHFTCYAHEQLCFDIFQYTNIIPAVKGQPINENLIIQVFVFLTFSKASFED